MKNKKLLNFSNTSISDVEYLNPLFSTCSIRVMYVGDNRNMTTISKEAVEKALPSIYGAPIVGEYNSDANDYKGHGGRIDLDTMSIVKTTRPYGFVPHDATYRWEKVISANNNQEYEYLVLDNCKLWTGNYPEAYEMLNGKGQSMEIIVNDGTWDEEKESYIINDFSFSALCVLGDDVEPCFEDAGINTSYSTDSTFQMEYKKMLEDAKATLYSKEENSLKLEDLLKKYSTTMKELTAKGFDVNETSEDNLEEKIAEVLGVEVKSEDFDENKDKKSENEEVGSEPEKAEDEKEDANGEENPVDEKADWVSPEDFEKMEATLNSKIESLEKQLEEKDIAIDELTEFKLNAEKKEHEAKAKELFEDFQLSEVDTADLDINEFSIEDLEKKCYEILGRKMKESKEFSKEARKNKIILHGDKEEKENTTAMDRLVHKFSKEKK